MADFRTMFDRAFLGAWDLPKPVTVVISGVKSDKIKGDGGKEDRKIILAFQGKQLGMVVNKTNARTIAGMYGNDTRGWLGKAVTLFATTTQVGPTVKDCIRIRPNIPQRTGPPPQVAQHREVSAEEVRAQLEQHQDRQDAAESVEREPGDDYDQEMGEVPMTDEERAAAIDRGEA